MVWGGYTQVPPGSSQQTLPKALPFFQETLPSYWDIIQIDIDGPRDDLTMALRGRGLFPSLLSSLPSLLPN